jgi:hypothetical protein
LDQPDETWDAYVLTLKRQKIKLLIGSIVAENYRVVGS